MSPLVYRARDKRVCFVITMIESIPEDTTDTPSPTVVLDLALLTSSNTDSGRGGVHHVPSVASTDLASTVGSVIGPSREAFLKSLTFTKEQADEFGGWKIQLSEPKKLPFSRQYKIYIDSLDGIFRLSKIREGDSLKSINSKRCGPSMSADRALQAMENALADDGILYIATGNKEFGDDILVEATIIKPRPDMIYEEMGMVVWHWGFLCIKSIDDESIFKHTVLRPDDHIVSINGIECDRVGPAQFKLALDTLTKEITIVAKRRKQRFTGKFG